MWRWLVGDAANRAEKITLVAELFIAAFLVVIDVVWPAGVWIASRMRLRGTFEVRLPKGREITAMTDSHGCIAVDIQVALRVTTSFERFNLRFSKTKSGGNVPSTTIEIKSVNARTAQLSYVYDGEGGCDCWWTDALPRKVYARKNLELIANVYVPGPWSGYLSFHGYDASDTERFVRVPIAFRPTQHPSLLT